MSFPIVHVELPTGGYRLSLVDYDEKVQIKNGDVEMIMDFQELWQAVNKLAQINSIVSPDAKKSLNREMMMSADEYYRRYGLK